MSDDDSVHTKHILSQLEESVKLERVRISVRIELDLDSFRKYKKSAFSVFLFNSMSDECDIDCFHDFRSGPELPGYI